MYPTRARMVECVLFMALLIRVNVGPASRPTTAKMVYADKTLLSAFLFAIYISFPCA